MAKGKRMMDNHSNKSTHKKAKNRKKNNSKKPITIFLIVLLIIILIVAGYLIFKFYPGLFNGSESSDFKAVISTELNDSKTVEGLEDVSITNINISTSDKDASIIEFHFKNTSNKNIEETKAHFYALNSDGHIIFGMPLTIPKLGANSEVVYKVLCTNNLSEAKDYEVSIE